MPPANLTTGTGLTGAIQKYLIKKLALEKEFETPLANLDIAIEAVIPKKSGQYAEIRLFGDIAEPDYVAEGEDPAAGAVLSSTVVQVPLREIAGYVPVSSMEIDTDWVDFLDRAYAALIKALRRKKHKVTQTALVTTYDVTAYGITFPNVKLPTIFANLKANFAALQAGDFITMADFIRARTRLENSRVQRPDDGFFRAVIDSAIRQQLEEDPTFLDVVKRHADLAKKTLIKGHICDFAGMRFVEQSEPWRETLGGAEGTRVDTGAVRTAHVLGKEAFSYTKLAGATGAKPKFKVQDISITGCETTIGYRMPFVAATVQPTNGVNIKGLSKYAETNE